MLSRIRRPLVIWIVLVGIALLLIIFGRDILVRMGFLTPNISDLEYLPVDTMVEVQGVVNGGDMSIGSGCGVFTSYSLYTYDRPATDNQTISSPYSLYGPSIPLVPGHRWGSYRIRGWLRRASCHATSPGQITSPSLLYIEVVEMTPIDHPYVCPQRPQDKFFCPEGENQERRSP
jgi:hypothetical protein